MQCSECRHYKKDVEYKGLGSCENQEVTGRLVFGNADYFLIADDFGCSFAEGTEQLLQLDSRINRLPVKQMLDGRFNRLTASLIRRIRAKFLAQITWRT